MKKKRKFRIAASITWKDTSRMTASGRHQIALWMRRKAAELEKWGPDIAFKQVRRYYY